MNTFCTIISPDYFPFALNLFNSLKKYDITIELQILVTAGDIKDNIKSTLPKELKIHFLKDLENTQLNTEIKNKYDYLNDSFRWTLKPIFISYLLNKFEKVIYVDCDIYFFHDFSFLFKELDHVSILLSPHWGETDPLVNEENFLLNFRLGLYNAGFIGATAKGKVSLEWWAKACSYAIKKDENKGLYDDQRFLDLIPIIDEHSSIIKHRGCNIGSWNITSNRRQRKGERILINDKYPIVFVHFNHETINQTLNGNDPLLLPYFKEYENSFEQNGESLEEFITPLSEWKKTNLFITLKRKTKIRTRIKNWLYRLSTK